MGKRSYELCLDGEVFNLRLTLTGQKHLVEKNPGTPILAIIMSAVDDPLDMENLLTEVLNWEGNTNSIRTGADLYDKMVDAGYAGAARFTEVVTGIAHISGLLDGPSCEKVRRAIESQLNRTFDSLLDMEAPSEITGNVEGGEGSDNPTPKTLDG